MRRGLTGGDTLGAFDGETVELSKVLEGPLLGVEHGSADGADEGSALEAVRSAADGETVGTIERATNSSELVCPPGSRWCDTLLCGGFCTFVPQTGTIMGRTRCDERSCGVGCVVLGRSYALG